MKKTAIIVLMLLLTFFICGCGEADTQGQTTNEEATSTTESEPEYDLNNFETYTYFLGKPLDVYGEAEYNSIGYRPDLDGDSPISSEKEAVYNSHLRTNWHYIPGNVIVVTNREDDTVIRIAMEYDDALQSTDLEKQYRYMEDRYGKGKEIEDGIVDFYWDDYFCRISDKYCTLGLKDELY